MWEIENLLNFLREININNKSKKVISARTRGKFIGRGQRGNIEILIKSDKKIYIASDINILLRPKIRYEYIDGKYQKLVKCYIDNKQTKGWININNIYFEQLSRL